MRKSFPRAELAALTGRTPLRERALAGAGYGVNTAKWTVGLDDGRRVFVKQALDELAAAWLRREHVVYAHLRARFLPSFVGWHDRVDRTFLVIEDLSDAHWPPPWRGAHIDAMRSALDELHATAPPPGLPAAAEEHEGNGWRAVADDPDAFLSLELCTAAWIERSLPALLAAADDADLAGDAFLHLDARGDNACIRGRQAILVDWNWAARGNPIVDLAGWLPSLRLEGGPDPWVVLADSRGFASWFAGFFLCRAPLPAPATAPRVRDFQRRQGAVALEWAARELGLPPPTLTA